MEATHQIPWRRTVLALLLFGAAFGYLEAAVVSYLRELHEPARQRFYPGRPASDLFPLLTLDQLHLMGSGHMRLLATELGREAATIIMLAAVALAVARDAGSWGAAFVIAFGTWDITFYVFLKVLLDWPASLFTWDILFLVPVPWVGPVLAPVLVSAAMITAGIWHFWSEARGKPIHISGRHWLGILTGAVIIVISFAMDYGKIMAGGTPRDFNWAIFLAGLGISCVSYGSATLRPSRRDAKAARAPGY